MLSRDVSLQLPEYQDFVDSIAILNLPISASELHGVMCGYLAAEASTSGESYIRALMLNKKEDSFREAARALFDIYAISQHQITTFGFDFQLLLPDDDALLSARAEAFSEWCEGFTQSMTMVGLGVDDFKNEDAQDAMAHITEFANLDYQSLDVDEADEKALIDVIEYARMAVLQIYTDIIANKLHSGDGSDAAH